MSRHHPRRVVVHWNNQRRIRLDKRPPAGAIIDGLNTHLTKTGVHTVSGATWTETGNLVIIAKMAEDTKALVGNFGGWMAAILPGAELATLDQKIHQVVIQQAWIRNKDSTIMTAESIIRELAETTSIEPHRHARPPCILAAKGTKVTHSAVLISLNNEEAANKLHKGIFFRHEPCKVNQYTKPTQVNR
ncbi:hypothetical protein CPB86DRAFT_816516 [Serendipita vermifera]|nr:hypothetical protein CPB86DRAFT_816516 [Serendipita vermifera]